MFNYSKQIIYSLIWISVIYIIAVCLYVYISQSYLPSDFFLVSGAISGLLLFVLLFWQYVLSLKVLTKFLHLNLSSVVSLHKVLGIYSVLLLVAHPLFLGIDSLLNTHSLNLIPDFSKTYDFKIFLGELGLLLFIFTWYLSYLIKNNLTFRFWKQMHLFAYAILPLTYLHADDIGTFLANPLLNLFIKGLTGLFGFMVLWRLLDSSGLIKYKYVVKSKNVYNDILEITFSPVDINNRIVTKLGQFIYIQVGAFRESHPFSVLWNSEKGDLILGVKIQGKFSKVLADLNVNDEVLLDGPHGEFLKNIETQKHVVFIAGGIGVTPFVEAVEKSNKLQNLNRLDFIYATRTLNDSVFINKSSIKNLSKVRLVNVVNNQDVVSGGNVEKGYVTFEIIKKYLGNLTNDCDYYICGPVPMMDAVTAQLKSNGIDKHRIHTEEFGW